MNVEEARRRGQAHYEIFGKLDEFAKHLDRAAFDKLTADIWEVLSLHEAMAKEAAAEQGAD
jgi:hypothetical protein